MPCSRISAWKPRFVICVTATSVDAEVEREDRDDPVAVDELAALVDREHPVAVAVEGDPEVEATRLRPSAGARRVSVAPQPTLMFVPSGSLPIACTSAPSRSNASRGEARVGAVRAVERDPEARQVGAEAGERRARRSGRASAAAALDRALRRRRAARRAAPRSPPRSRRAASARARSKNLTPLYSGGLCEAEMTTPRSSAASATAGVGSTPPRTAVRARRGDARARAPPRARRPRRACRARRRRARAPLQSVAARPSRSTSSAVSNSPTTPRTPSVPK